MHKFLFPDFVFCITSLKFHIGLEPLSFEVNTFSGAFLMNHGLEIPCTHHVDWGKKDNWSGRVLLSEALSQNL